MKWYNFNCTVVLLHKNIKCTTMKFKWSSMSPQTEKVARAWTSTKITQKLNYLKISDLEKARNFEFRSILRQKYAEKYRKHRLTLSSISTALSTEEGLAWPNFFNILILNSCLNINICNFWDRTKGRCGSEKAVIFRAHHAWLRLQFKLSKNI